MSDETPHNHDDEHASRGVQIANQIIDLANKQLESGESPEAIASGMRHAAANFSAFAFFGIKELPKDPNTMVDEFIDFFEHYLGVHKPKDGPTDGLAQLIQQAKNEL
ncbi:MAG: DUF3144 domain-containing protein [Alphaproteobacteria bacterium]|nr:DUF3144 domain-containing protein [Alphaproteobacteria bacterium]MBT4018031.1 DUF3144 domain-containing protein [Alphaproteobacteria bacterium]MBT4967250.1 DUF3144 domain-containing protein [Alphaproteobacteria bacterium]MBT5160572.1 DUF3144 domain-containing protein [Alphaproteobacteria bacterium]MBT5920015.1 DUF3144 domain-containing protein [Alphaproteobacteria bacterium]